MSGSLSAHRREGPLAQKPSSTVLQPWVQLLRSAQHSPSQDSAARFATSRHIGRRRVVVDHQHRRSVRMVTARRKDKNARVCVYVYVYVLTWCLMIPCAFLHWHQCGMTHIVDTNVCVCVCVCDCAQYVPSVVLLVVTALALLLNQKDYLIFYVLVSCTHRHTHIHTHTHTHTHKYTHTHFMLWTHTHIHTHTIFYVSVSYMCDSPLVSSREHTYTYRHTRGMHTHTHTHMHTS